MRQEREVIIEELEPMRHGGLALTAVRSLGEERIVSTTPYFDTVDFETSVFRFRGYSLGNTGKPEPIVDFSRDGTIQERIFEGDREEALQYHREVVEEIALRLE